MNDDYMISFQNETKQTIEASYKKMTAVERSVADFFIGNITTERTSRRVDDIQKF